jgi:hypothetical protein
VGKEAVLVGERKNDVKKEENRIAKPACLVVAGRRISQKQGSFSRTPHPHPQANSALNHHLGAIASGLPPDDLTSTLLGSHLQY